MHQVRGALYLKMRVVKRETKRSVQFFENQIIFFSFVVDEGAEGKKRDDTVYPLPMNTVIRTVVIYSDESVGKKVPLAVGGISGRKNSRVGDEPFGKGRLDQRIFWVIDPIFDGFFHV